MLSVMLISKAVDTLTHAINYLCKTRSEEPAPAYSGTSAYDNLRDAVDILREARIAREKEAFLAIYPDFINEASALTAPADAVLLIVDYITSAVLFFATQRSADYFTYTALDSSGGQPKRGIFYAAHTALLKHKQVSISGPLEDEFRMYLSEKTARTRDAQESAQDQPARYIAYEVRPVVETEGNDESKNVESFLSLVDAQTAYRDAVRAAAWETDGISAADVGEDEYDDIAADNDIRLFWTLYGVNPDGTSDAITDTETEAQAFETLHKITGIAGVSGTVRYAVPNSAESEWFGAVFTAWRNNDQEALARLRAQIDAEDADGMREQSQYHPDGSRRLFDDGRSEPAPTAAERLEYLRGELRAERISYGELTELESLVDHIAPDDVELLEAAGVPERTDDSAPNTPAQDTHDHSGEMDAAGYPEGHDGELSPADAEREYYQRNPHRVPGR